MPGAGTIAVGVVVVWLLATIGYQYAPLRGFIGRFDALHLLPSWSFFAPNPATRDSHVVVRDMLRDGSFTSWRPISEFPTRSLLQVVWHPAKRPRKILRDASKSIKQTRGRSSSKGVVQCSLPYLMVLHHCNAQVPRVENAIARQFAIVETSGRENRRIWLTFISELHRW